MIERGALLLQHYGQDFLSKQTQDSNSQVAKGLVRHSLLKRININFAWAWLILYHVSLRACFPERRKRVSIREREKERERRVRKRGAQKNTKRIKSGTSRQKADEQKRPKRKGTKRPRDQETKRTIGCIYAHMHRETDRWTGRGAHTCTACTHAHGHTHTHTERERHTHTHTYTHIHTHTHTYTHTHTHTYTHTYTHTHTHEQG